MEAIRLSQKQSDAWHYLEDKETTEVLYGGAAGGGKSLLGCIWHIRRRKQYPETRGLIGRSTLKALKESTMVTFFKACKMLGYISGVDYSHNAQENYVKWDNGSVTQFKDLAFYPSDPDFDSLGSTEYTDVFVDELPGITRKAWDVVKSRIRWMLNDYNLIPKALATCNPSPGWVKEDYIKDIHGKAIILKPYQKFVQALLTDNPDEKFRALYNDQLSKISSDYDRQRLLYGDWDVERDVLNPFAFQYSQSKHESIDAVFDQNKQLLIKIDFNLNPFAVTFTHLWRDQAGEHWRTFDEASIQNGSIPAMGDLLEARYGNQLYNCFVTGDSMGHKGEISQRDNASLYLQLQRRLKLKDAQIRTPRGNPTHENSRADMNFVLTHFPDFKINPITCPQLCMDMRTVQCDAFGSIVKRDRNDLSQRADFLDTERYGVNTFLRKWIDTNMKFKK